MNVFKILCVVIVAFGLIASPTTVRADAGPYVFVEDVSSCSKMRVDIMAGGGKVSAYVSFDGETWYNASILDLEVSRAWNQFQAIFVKVEVTRESEKDVAVVKAVKPTGCKGAPVGGCEISTYESGEGEMMLQVSAEPFQLLNIYDSGKIYANGVRTNRMGIAVVTLDSPLAGTVSCDASKTQDDDEIVTEAEDLPKPAVCQVSASRYDGPGVELGIEALTGSFVEVFSFTNWGNSRVVVRGVVDESGFVYLHDRIPSIGLITYQISIDGKEGCETQYRSYNGLLFDDGVPFGE